MAIACLLSGDKIFQKVADPVRCRSITQLWRTGRGPGTPPVPGSFMLFTAFTRGRLVKINPQSTRQVLYKQLLGHCGDRFDMICLVKIARLLPT